MFQILKLIIRARISVLVGFYIRRPQHFIHLKPLGFKSVSLYLPLDSIDLQEAAFRRALTPPAYAEEKDEER